MHYEYVGHVAHVWTGAVSIEVEAAIGVKLGDRAFDLDVAFEE
jgi:hypothetical protein